MVDDGKQDILDEFEELQAEFPLNAIDELIIRCGGHSAVSEISGRNHRQEPIVDLS